MCGNITVQVYEYCKYSSQTPRELYSLLEDDEHLGKHGGCPFTNPKESL